MVLPSTSATLTYRAVEVDGLGLFYREAGPRDALTILLLRGFPSSSHIYDTPLPPLADRYHLVAPDYPGFGHIGSELARAADMPFASREKAIISQFEVGAGFAPGGGPMARLPRLVGRGRAMEILIGADEFNGELAERYGYVNRALPDAELDGFVDALATRIASFDRQTIVDTKNLVDLASLPPDAESQTGWDTFITSVQ